MLKNINKIILITALFLPSFGLAATLYPSYGGNVMFELNPKNPGANSSVTIKATSYSIDLTGSKISWYVGDKLEMEGNGKDSFSFKTGAVGKPITIKMVAENDAKRVGRAISITPADIDAVWEANTYVPPSYRGKALAASKSSVKIVAIPQFKTENGTNIPSSEIKYEWKKGNAVLLSGFGKNVLNTDVGSPLAGENIILLASDKSGTIVAEKKIEIVPEDPEVVFYKENPAEGTNYNMALKGTIGLEGKEVSVRAEPFFFSYPSYSKGNNLLFSWKVDGKGVNPNEGTPKIITLRNETGQDITSSISLSIKNAQKLFQETTSGFSLSSSAGFKF
ncbi:MAG TPA: hypothetical protein P5056_03260 [Candidatus Paceibacterota bacterium]|nr:hypothetical protein [Candidatus Paceibacterota bacterium]